MLIRAVALSVALVVPGGAAWVGARAEKAETNAERRWPPVGDFVEIGGTRVHYAQQGEGPDVVLIHGAGGNLRDFTFSLMERLARHYRVTAFDRPGLGYTGRPDGALTGTFNARAESPQLQASVLAEASARLGLTRPVVLGHSYGGSVAMAWGLNHPASALVIVSGAVMPWPGSLGAQYKVLGSALGGAAVPPVVTAFTDPMQTGDVVASIFEPQAAPPGYLDHVGPGLTLRRETMRANARQVNTLRPHIVDLSGRYASLDLPVEFIHGDADEIVPLAVHAQRAAPLIAKSNLTVLPGIGHMPHHSREGAVIEAVRRAVDRSARR